MTPKLGESKWSSCPECGKKLRVIYVDKAWRGTCKCGNHIIEYEGDTTKVEGQL